MRMGLMLLELLSVPRWAYRRSLHLIHSLMEGKLAKSAVRDWHRLERSRSWSKSMKRMKVIWKERGIGRLIGLMILGVGLDSIMVVVEPRDLIQSPLKVLLSIRFCPISIFNRAERGTYLQYPQVDDVRLPESLV